MGKLQTLFYVRTCLRVEWDASHGLNNKNVYAVVPLFKWSTLNRRNDIESRAASEIIQKRKLLKLWKSPTGIRIKKNISSVDRELNENGFYLNKTTKEADFYGLFAFKMNDSHSNLVNSVLNSWNGNFSFSLFKPKPVSGDTKKKKNHITFNIQLCCPSGL